MRKLSAMDASFLFQESARTPMHLASLLELQLPAHQTPEQFVDRFPTHLTSKLPDIPLMTHRLRYPAWSPQQPVWEAVGDLEVMDHLQFVQLRHPNALHEAIAARMSTCLDRSAPLWDITVYTGLGPGQVALLLRYHHACIGAAMAACIEGVGGNAAQLLPNLLPPLMPSLVSPVLQAAQVWQQNLDPTAHALCALQPAPSSPFSHLATARRSVSAGKLDLAPLQAAAKVTHSSLAELFMHLCAEGLYRYLQRREQLPATALQAAYPVTTCSNGTADQLQYLRIALGTQLTDPAARLQFVRDANRYARQGLTALRITPEQLAPAALLQGLSTLSATFGTGAATSPVNLIIHFQPTQHDAMHNTLQDVMHIDDGVRVQALTPLGPINHGCTLNISAHPAAGQLCFGINACADALPHAAELRDDLCAAGQQLLQRLAPLLPAGADTEPAAMQTSLSAPPASNTDSNSAAA